MSEGIKKTEHNGAKRGKGYWGTKLEAKTKSKIARRLQDRNLKFGTQ